MKKIIITFFTQILITGLITLITYSANASKMCVDLFDNDPFIKQYMPREMAKQATKSVQSLQNSTTGARIENKWTLKREKIEELIESLQINLADSSITVKARDKVTPGTRNVTHTVYLDKFELMLKGSGLKIGSDFKDKSITFKIRIRKYGTVRNDQVVAPDNVQFAAFTKDYSFVEFKFSDPRFNGAVFKPRMYMADEFIKLFGQDAFLHKFEEIKSHTLSLKENSANKESVEAMLEFIKIGHLKKSSFTPLAVNLYERISYAIDFVDRSKNNASFQIQMTLDKSIAFFTYALGKTIAAYGENDSVVEIKTPVEYAKYNLNSDLSNIDGYSQFLQFVQSVQTHHLSEYSAGVGKMGHGHKQYILETKNHKD